MWIKIWR